ncbi:MAG TPA: nucleotide exchange factor GrpE [Candidatus Rifleibacterium sp.]|nr:nucleotide exchange factor GrpE [Candidatus Rifleibacterium sp.]
MNPEANGEISNEFFKKLNQQIVQKDNLIKLLQLQIRNLKTQIEAGGAGSEELDHLKKALEEKASEADRLLTELSSQKSQFGELELQKDEQIKALSQMLEQHQASSSTVADVVDDPRIPELEQIVSTMREELAAANQNAEMFKAQLQASEQALAALKDIPAQSNPSPELQSALVAAQAEILSLNATVENLKKNLAEREAVAAMPVNDPELEIRQNRILELEQDVANLRNIITENEEVAKASAGGAAASEALARAQAEIVSLNAAMADMKSSPVVSAAITDELEHLRQENSRIAELKNELSRVSADASGYTEAAMKVTALEAEREHLANELERLKIAGADSGQIDALKLEIARLREIDRLREDELARLRVSIEARQDDSMSDPAVREEVEQLTRQVADQLLAIQNFEGMISKTRSQIEQKDKEIEVLRGRLGSGATPAATSVIPVTGESEIITSFIDFFDGLDSLLNKNPLPELQSLHQKLLDRLIIPNQITYMQVISEEFNPDMHSATDYFRSSKFPERCIVFEVEKGYRKGDLVIKKSKVWVVQNLYNCMACGAAQGNSDSRFCHLCGAKIVAPNGLPVDSLPEFEPTPTTYQRFAERMLASNDQQKAREYILAGLELDSNFVPLMVRLADIMTADSQFEEAMELLNKSYSLKPDQRTMEKIKSLETKLSIFKQAKNLKLSAEEFEKLLHLIQK